jgi:CheY-like chemotaxis protein
VSFPLAPEHSDLETAAPELEPEAAVRRRQVLVVDDNADAAVMLSDVLIGEGHLVRLAHDGPAALKLLADFKPDLALLDIGLPVMDGYELARRIRSNESLGGIRLIAVTGYGDDRAKSKARQAGFDRLLVKPVDLAQLQEVLASLS